MLRQVLRVHCSTVAGSSVGVSTDAKSSEPRPLYRLSKWNIGEMEIWGKSNSLSSFLLANVIYLSALHAKYSSLCVYMYNHSFLQKATAQQHATTIAITTTHREFYRLHDHGNKPLYLVCSANLAVEVMKSSEHTYPRNILEPYYSLGDNV